MNPGVTRVCLGIVVGVLVFPRGLAGQFPYELTERDAALVPAALAMFGLGGLATDHVPPVTDSVLSLPESGGLVGFIDGYAESQWSEAWDSRSDDGRSLLVGAAGAAFASNVLTRSRWDASSWATLAVMAIEAGAFTKGVTDIVKGTVERTRPYTRNQDLPLTEKRDEAARGGDVFLSFFSGHSASAFASAAFASTVVSDLFDLCPNVERAIWVGTMATAGYTAWARVKAGKHYPTDVLVGAVVGTTIGHLVPRFHRREARRPGRRAPDLSLIPLSTGGIGLGLTIPAR